MESCNRGKVIIGKSYTLYLFAVLFFSFYYKQTARPDSSYITINKDDKNTEYRNQHGSYKEKNSKGKKTRNMP
jgi:hypothetical protein